jgi:hypothetical protein
MLKVVLVQSPQEREERDQQVSGEPVPVEWLTMINRYRQMVADAAQRRKDVDEAIADLRNRMNSTPANSNLLPRVEDLRREEEELREPSPVAWLTQAGGMAPGYMVTRYQQMVAEAEQRRKELDGVIADLRNRMNSRPANGNLLPRVEEGEGAG